MCGSEPFEVDPSQGNLHIGQMHEYKTFPGEEYKVVIARSAGHDFTKDKSSIDIVGIWSEK
jgi:hypothetical protein